MQIAGSRTREQFPLSTKKVLKKTLTGTIGWIVLLLFFFIIFAVPASFDSKGSAGSYIGMAALVLLVLIAIVLAIVYYYQKWYYATYFYDLTPDYIVIKKGPITPREITIPYERVQDVYVDQDILDRIFGLYDVHLSSATISSGMSAHIDGVEKEAADGLRAALLKTVSERIGKNRAPVPVPPPAPTTIQGV